MKLKPWVKKLLSFIMIGIIIGIIGFEVVKYFHKDTEKVDNSLLKEHNIAEKYASKTLEYVLKNNIYEEKYLEEYAKIEFNDAANFKEILLTFLPKGYPGEEINYLFNLSQTNLDKLKEKDYLDLQNYYQIKNFNVDNFERYNAYYQKNSKYSYADVVTYVNINLDLPVYTNPAEVSEPNDLLVLVNKYNCLPKNYSPSDLTNVNGTYGSVPMRRVAKEALEKLQKAVQSEANFVLLPTTAYRNYSFQSTLYNNYVAKDGVAAADTYSARPGCSEHQTGLAIDLKNPATSNDIRLTAENYEWLKNNAYRFGFIIRFPKAKEFITGYQEENWHIRYVGMDAAKTIYENNLTLEEYVDLYVKKY